jgi:hypothetical protein
MYASLELQKSKKKKSFRNVKKIGDYKNEVGNEICNIKPEIVKLRQE